MKRYILFLYLLCFLCTSCGKYYHVSTSLNQEEKWNGAKQFYENGKYLQAASLFEDLLPMLKGTSKAEECLYLLAQSYFKQKDYESSCRYFYRYYSSYPTGEYTELSHYYCGYGYYYSSPDYDLDQTPTMNALDEFQIFLEYYPGSQLAEEVQKLIDELNDKLAFKAYKSAELYYNLGNYMGNNYAACVVTAKNTLNDYPFTKHREELYMLILRAKYQEARKSVLEKQPERYRSVIDEFYNYRNEYPEGKYMKEATQYYKEAQAYTQSDQGSLSDELLKSKKSKKAKRNRNTIQ